MFPSQFASFYFSLDVSVSNFEDRPLKPANFLPGGGGLEAIARDRHLGGQKGLPFWLFFCG